ncbi:MAG: glycosyltransferase family 2 protein, partial [Ferruginibacter sp.]
MATPLISVVIPTANRPQYLPRAIESALAGMTPGEVEVIVVPNGLDESWRSVAENYRHHLSVIWLPTQIAHANVARNIGLVQARGKFIRFLDDDDFIYPTAASEQIDLLEKTGDELCSGLVMNLDDHSEQLGTLGFPDTKDFVCAALSVSGFTLPVGNVFLRNTLRAARWDESVNRAQDNVWMVQLAAIKEWKWVHLEKHVGVWFQHPGQRVSTVSTASDRPNNIIDAITGLHRRLSEQSRL